MIGILSLAIGAVCSPPLVVAVVTHWLMPSLPWAACAALGAIVSPPDAVSARAVLQRIKLPRRLSILLEGESLLNDATGLVLFRFAVAARDGSVQRRRGARKASPARARRLSRPRRGTRSGSRSATARLHDDLT